MNKYSYSQWSKRKCSRQQINYSKFKNTYCSNN